MQLAVSVIRAQIAGQCAHDGEQGKDGGDLEEVGRRVDILTEDGRQLGHALDERLLFGIGVLFGDLLDGLRQGVVLVVAVVLEEEVELLRVARLAVAAADGAALAPGLVGTVAEAGQQGMQDLRVIVNEVAEIDNHLVVEHVHLALVGSSGLGPILEAILRDDVLHEVPVVAVAVVVVALLLGGRFVLRSVCGTVGDGVAGRFDVDVVVGEEFLAQQEPVLAGHEERDAAQVLAAGVDLAVVVNVELLGHGGNVLGDGVVVRQVAQHEPEALSAGCDVRGEELQVADVLAYVLVAFAWLGAVVDVEHDESGGLHQRGLALSGLALAHVGDAGQALLGLGVTCAECVAQLLEPRFLEHLEQARVVEFSGSLSAAPS